MTTSDMSILSKIVRAKWGFRTTLFKSSVEVERFAILLRSGLLDIRRFLKLLNRFLQRVPHEEAANFARSVGLP